MLSACFFFFLKTFLRKMSHTFISIFVRWLWERLFGIHGSRGVQRITNPQTSSDGERGNIDTMMKLLLYPVPHIHTQVPHIHTQVPHIYTQVPHIHTQAPHIYNF